MTLLHLAQYDETLSDPIRIAPRGSGTIALGGRAVQGRRRLIASGAFPRVALPVQSRGCMTFATTDLCDRHEDRLARGELRIVTPGFLHLGRKRRFAGEAVTLKLFEDNSLVRAALEEPGAGRVLVVDGGGSLRCALVGGNLGALAARNGWSGILVNGCVRDAEELDACDLGVRALALHPQKSVKKNVGERGVPVQFPGALIRPGNFVYADADGILVSDAPLG